MKKALAFLMLFLGGAVLAQESASFKLKEHTFNTGGNPQDGIMLTSASFQVTLSALGDDAAATGCDSRNSRTCEEQDQNQCDSNSRNTDSDKDGSITISSEASTKTTSSDNSTETSKGDNCNGATTDGDTPSGIFDGSITIENDSDVLLYQNVTEVQGDLTITAPGLQSVSLPCLVTIEGNLMITENTALENVDLLALTSVGGALNVNSNAALASIDLSKVETVGENLWVFNNAALPTFDLSSVISVGGNLIIDNNTALTSFDLSSVTSVGGALEFIGNTALCQKLADELRDQLKGNGWTGAYYSSENKDGC